jgi:hypothetical protein
MRGNFFSLPVFGCREGWVRERSEPRKKERSEPRKKERSEPRKKEQSGPRKKEPHPALPEDGEGKCAVYRPFRFF